jgi:diaminohydroxyphosphoribosylaminopyrimidine deaminase/5-amino-6-(5-phosphoribosylamino)uracil reductase
LAINDLLTELGHRRMTNVLVEGGGELLGSLFDAGAIDEVHVFIAPKIIGGQSAKSPIGGAGVDQIASALNLADLEKRHVGDDIYLHGRIASRD